MLDMGSDAMGCIPLALHMHICNSFQGTVICGRQWCVSWQSGSFSWQYLMMRPVHVAGSWSRGCIVLHGEERTSPATPANQHEQQSTMEAEEICKKQRGIEGVTPHNDKLQQKKQRPHTRPNHRQAMQDNTYIRHVYRDVPSHQESSHQVPLYLMHTLRRDV